MELTFHSLDELREFLAWRDEQHERALNGERPPVGQYKTILAEEAAAADIPVAAGAVLDTLAATYGDPSPKRTRRTKAQIEAARQAAEETARVTAMVEGTDHPVLTSYTTAVNVSLPPEPQNEQAEQPAEPGDAGAWPTDYELVCERASHIVADPAAHLKDSRDFIAAWGLPAYFETQQAAKVGNNAITYEAGDRARHAAAMQLYAETHNKTGG